MADLPSTQDKAFSFAQDLVKQVITLSSGIITISIAFNKDFVGPGAPHGAKILLAISWLFYILAVIFGVLTLMALTGSLSNNETTISGSNMRLPAGIHISSFIVGLGLTIAAGWWAL
jgi:hypothetical protein